MELEAQLVTNGIYCGESSAYNSERAKELEAGSADWRLLFQIDADDELKVDWGLGGALFFWIREVDARMGDFSNTWLILQC